MWLNHGNSQRAGEELTVIAWLWVRTVKCPNPACGVQMPLTSKWILSKKGEKLVWVEPIVHQESPPKIIYNIKTGKGPVPEGTVTRQGGICIACGTPVPFDYIRGQGKKGNLGVKLISIATEGNKNRAYFPPILEQESIAFEAKPKWKPEVELPDQALGFRIQLYGMTTYGDLFTARQLVALSTFCDLINEVRVKIVDDISTKINHSNFRALIGENFLPEAYADSIITYLACAISRSADFWSGNATWTPSGEFIGHTFTRQALPMVWDFAEGNPFSESSGNWLGAVEWVSKVLEQLPGSVPGFSLQNNAMDAVVDVDSPIICTDHPYYDNIGYADLSDYFYIWLRRAIGKVYPELFATLLTPKSAELIATPFRFDGDKKKAQEFFENGLRKVFHHLRHQTNISFPLTIFYAFKQTEEKDGDDNRVSTGWETMLEGLVSASYQITGTWPMRTERSARSVSQGTNALASSVLLVCRPRLNSASTITRRDFWAELKRELPSALRKLQLGNIAPVDLAQAAIGPGMAVFSRYKQVLEADGSPMRVRTALALINQALDEFLAEQEGEYDADTRWALAWYEQYGFNEGPFGVAETLSKAKNTSVGGLGEAGVLVARAGKVRLLSRTELK